MLLSFVPLEVGGCKQFTSCKRSGEPVRQARELSEGFNWNIPFKCRRLKPWFDFFQRISGEWKGRPILIFWGVDAQEIPGGTPEAYSRPCILSGFLPHDLLMGRIPHAGSWQMIQEMLEIWSLVPLSFLKAAWTSGSSWFAYCWSLA